MSSCAFDVHEFIRSQKEAGCGFVASLDGLLFLLLLLPLGGSAEDAIAVELLLVGVVDAEAVVPGCGAAEVSTG